MPTIFDQSAIDTSSSANISGRVSAEDFTLNATYSLTGGMAVLNDDTANDNGLLDSFSGTLGWAIYSSDAGIPGTLLFSGQDSTLTYTDTGLTSLDCDVVSVGFEFDSPITLEAGTYFLALHEGNWGSALDGSVIWWQWASAGSGADLYSSLNLASPSGWETEGLKTAFSLEGIATFVVTTALDVVNAGDGVLSLREAVTLANANADANIIKFDASLAGSTITLSSAVGFGQLALTQDVTIDGDVNGDNKADITISGGDAVRILSMSGGDTEVDLLSLTLTDGNAGVGYGGAVSAIAIRSLDIANTTISNSEAKIGGGLYVVVTDVTLTNSLISGNYSSFSGGGIFLGEGSLVATNTTIYGNTTIGDAGGIFAYDSTLTLLNSTVTGNRAGAVGSDTNGGGGIYDLVSTITITNTVVAGNWSGSGNVLNDVSGTVASANNSVFGTDVFITAASNVKESVTNLGLGALADNGGTVMTMLPEDGSILIDAGDTSQAPAGTAANGLPRVSGAAVDVGAAESIPANIVVSTTEDEDDGDYSAGDLSLREAVKLANSSDDANIITFDAGLAGETITLSSAVGFGQLALTQDVTIDGDVNGDNKADITISGNGQSRIFEIQGSGTDAALLSLTLTDGFDNGAGGAVNASDAGSLLIRDTTLSESNAFRGGAIFSLDTTTTIANSLISGNTASASGGGIFSVSSDLTLQNTTIYANTAGAYGGGVLLYNSGSTGIFNSTIFGNSADTDGANAGAGGGLNNTGTGYNTSTGYVVLYNSVVAGNVSGSGQAANDISGNLNFTGNSAIGALGNGSIGTNGGGNLLGIADAGLVPLADNGGTVMTLTLQQGSVLIDAGSNTRTDIDKTDLDDDGNTTEQLPTDADGGPRISGGTVDIGASEFNTPLVVTTSEDVVDAGDGFLSLREAVALANAGADADTIVFDADLEGHVITLNGTQLELTQDVTIDGDVNGDNKADITISGGDAVRIFNITGEDTDVDLKSLTLTGGNVGTGSGGAIRAFEIGTLDIADTTITKSAAQYGGGLYANGTAVTLTNSLISGNTANGAGGIYLQISTLSAVNTTIHGNTAVVYGGGVGAAGSTVTLLNSTLTGNNAYAGGTGTDKGGGIDDFGSILNIVNSVVAGNTSGNANTANDVHGAVSTATNSAFGTNVDGVTGGVNGNIENVTAGQLLLGALADNGGTVLTQNIEGALSVLFNKGSNAAASGIAEDANGNERIGDGRVDIGATEFTGPLVVTTELDVVKANDGLLSLREAVALANAGADGDTITFASNLAGKTITLNSTLGQLTLTQDVTIDGDVNGDNKADITISGGDATRIFSIPDGTTDVELLSLTLTDGNGTGSNDGFGGAIDNFGSLTIIDSTIKDSTASINGGAISTAGELNVINSAIYGNQADVFSGAITAFETAVTLTNSTVFDNTATYGIISATHSTLTIESSTVVGNTSSGSETILFYQPLTLTIENSVVAQNTVRNDIFKVSGVNFVVNNSAFGTNVDGVTGGTNGNLENVTAGQLLLGQLLDNGGSVLTLAPLDGSILINRGKTSLLPLDIHDIDGDGNVTERLPTDATGEARIQKPLLDIGAVEYTQNETITGTAGADVIVGGLGRDTLIGRAGADTLDGGAGKDTADYSASAQGVTVTLRTGAGVSQGGDAQGDILIGIDNLTGSAQADSLTGNAIINVLAGNGGADTLNGQSGNDTLLGGAGNDRLIGGTGIDKLTGGADADTFVLNNLAVNYDVIFDFTAGVDTLEISASLFGGGLVAGAVLTADQFIANLIGAAKDLEDRFILGTNTGALFFDADGSGAGERVLIAIFRDPVPSLTHEDFAIV